jgi:hypothetical protein
VLVERRVNSVHVVSQSKVAVKDTFLYLRFFINAKEVRTLFQAFLTWEAMPEWPYTCPLLAAPLVYRKMVMETFSFLEAK